MPTFIETLPASTTVFFSGIEDTQFEDVRQLSLVDAWICAEAAALTYKDDAFIVELGVKLRPELWQVRTFSEGPTSAILICRDGIAILAFRGTRVVAFPDILRKAPIDFQDLTTDFSIALMKHPKRGLVHAGFFGAYTRFWAIHGKEILDLTAHRSLFVTGHSLGAAIATVAARDLELVRALYTFGSPRVGDAEFQAGFIDIGLPVYRFVHEYDLVATVPLEEMNYRHVGDMLHIKGEGKAVHLATADRQHTVFDSLTQGVTVAPTFLVEAARFIVQHIGKLDLENAPVPDVALAQHAPWNYSTKLKALKAGARGNDGNGP